MNYSSKIAITIGILMLILTLINSMSINEITPVIQRSEIISALTSISILLVGFLQQKPNLRVANQLSLNGKEGFYISNNVSEELRNELAWGSHMILTATASSTVLIYANDTVLLRRGLISDDKFVPGKICLTSIRTSKYISLVNTKFYPGKHEFDSIVKNLPSVIVFPIGSEGWLIIGGWSERCYTKSDELWINGWARKLVAFL